MSVMPPNPSAFEVKTARVNVSEKVSSLSEEDPNTLSNMLTVCRLLME